ncbi:MAG: dihydrodipicolinate synthase family protein [Candidatus Velamenicoccus archaeovorus]
MMEHRAPAGIVCSLVTPFRRDQTPDLPALGELIDAQGLTGVHGLFLLGTAGEGVLLSADERKAVVEWAVERVAGRIPVLVHCGAPDTETSADLARHAGSLGVEAEASVAPYFFSYGGSALFEHYRAIAEAAPDIGHYVYENPERVGYSVGVPTVVRLVREVPGIRGVKDTGDSIGRIGRYLAELGDGIEVYAGNNEIVVPALTIGARGAVSAIASAVPELLVALYERWAEGKQQEAMDLQRAVALLHRCIEGMPYLGAIKHLARRRGLPGGGMRAPQQAVTSEQAAEIDRRLDAVEELRPWLQPLG